MRYEAPRVGRVLLTSMVLHYASPRPEGSTAERSKSLTARRCPPSYPRRTPRCAVEGRARRNLDQPITELSAARIAGARNVSLVGSGQSELAARPEGNFPGCKALKNHETGKESRPPRAVAGRPSEHLRRANPPGLLRRLPKLLQSPCRGSTRKGVA